MTAILTRPAFAGLLVAVLSCSAPADSHSDAHNAHATRVDATRAETDATVVIEDAYHWQIDAEITATDANPGPADSRVAWDVESQDCGTTGNSCWDIADRFGVFITALITANKTCTTSADCALLTPILRCTGSDGDIQILSCPVFANQNALMQIESTINVHHDDLCIVPCPRESCVVTPSCIGSEVADCSQGICL